METMKATATKGGHWAAINEVSFVAGMRLLFWIFRLFGRWPFRLVLYPVLLWYVLSKPRPRRASLDYLRRVGRLVAVQGGMRGVMRHFASFAEAILDKMLLWGGWYQTDKTTFHGVEPILERIRENQGGLLICSHLGNMELCRVLARQCDGLRLTVLVHTKHAQAFNRMMAALNPGSQHNLMQVTDMTPATAILLSERIAQGEYVVIAGDRVPVSPRPRVAPAQFLGAPAAFPVGPYVLAGILQCPIFLLFSLHFGTHSEIHFELLRASVRLPRKGREAALAELAAAYAARLEHHCLRAPLQWFNFYDFWHLPDMESSDAP